MEIGMIGLGRMGGNMVLRLLRQQHRVIGFDRSADAVKDVQGQGAVGAGSLEDLVNAFNDRPRIFWVMLPAGKPTSETIHELVRLSSEGDIIIDGGNSNWRDAVQDAEYVRTHGRHYMDAGTSGGVWGNQYGYCLMVGGEKDVYDHCVALLQSLAPDEGGLVHTGPEGSGHFVKMVHNGIEYAMMQAYAEGWELLEKVDSVDNVREVYRSWQQGTVIRSWLLDLAVNALDEDEHLDKLKGFAQDSGEGRWTVEAAIDHAVPLPAITASLFTRFASRQDDSPQMKMIAALRNQFGGHAVESK
jgi:6-phosphogluconate dehydrogenase